MPRYFGEFFMPILEEWHAIPARRSASAFAHSSTGGTSWIENFCGNGLEKAALSLGYLVPLTLNQMISSSGGT
jgi:hypothetical protein